LANISDFIELWLLLSDEVTKAQRITKATVQRCISMLTSHWDDEQLEAFVG